MEHDPIRNDARRARRSRQLGDQPACARCGLATPAALVAARRTLLEAHHVVGRAHDDRLTLPLCRNCHAILTEGQRDAGMDFAEQPTVLHRLAAVLTALGCFFAELGRTCAAWAASLIELARGLDGSCPGWRSLPAAGNYAAGP